MLCLLTCIGFSLCFGIFLVKMQYQAHPWISTPTPYLLQVANWAHSFPQAPRKCSTGSWYFDHRSQLKNFRNKQLWENGVFITYFLNAFQLHNTNMRKTTPENSLLFFFLLVKKSILNISVCNHSHFIGAKINGFFSSYVIVFNLMCTQIYV